MRYDRDPSSVGVSVVLPESARDRVFVDVVNNQEMSNIVQADGTLHKAIPHIYGGAHVEVDWSDGTWHVRAVKASS
jgi:hypothetical protein